MKRAFAFRALALAVALSTASCSWIFMRSAPDPPVRQEPQCSTTRIPAFLDLYVGVPYLVLGIALLAISATWTDEEDQNIAQTLGGVAAGFGGVLAWSGSSGLRMARECRDAEAEYEEWVNNRGAPAAPKNPWETRPVTPGAEGGMCARGNTCDPGLTCASGFCVRLP